MRNRFVFVLRVRNIIMTMQAQRVFPARERFAIFVFPTVFLALQSKFYNVSVNQKRVLIKRPKQHCTNNPLV